MPTFTPARSCTAAASAAPSGVRPATRARVCITTGQQLVPSEGEVSGERRREEVQEVEEVEEVGEDVGEEVGEEVGEAVGEQGGRGSGRGWWQRRWEEGAKETVGRG